MRYARAILVLSAFSATLAVYLLLYSLKTASSILPRSTMCPGFDGNPDLYGLGIRLGVYLQWFSSWLSNTIDPAEAAADNHSANSIFLLAILIALTVAVPANEIRPAEAYIMIMICFGFVLTVLSVFGIRIFFLRFSSLSLFLDTHSTKISKLIDMSLRPYTEYLYDYIKIVKSVTSIPSSQYCKSLLQWVLQGPLMTGNAQALSSRLDEFDFLRHPSLSWSGVVWRITILCYLTGFSMWLWWSSWILEHDRDGTGACVSSVYFFGPQPLASGLTIFYKIATTALSIFALGLALFILPRVLIIMNGLIYTEGANLILRDGIMDPSFRMPFGTFKMVFEVAGKFNPSLFAISQLFDATVGGAANHDDPRERIEFMMRRGQESHSISTGSEKHKQNWPYAFHFSVCFHISVLVTMACFVAFIEKTIIGANIAGVYSIRSTGQLIPFIIGVVSSLRTITRVIILYWLNNQKKKAEDVETQEKTPQTSLGLDHAKTPRTVTQLDMQRRHTC